MLSYFSELFWDLQYPKMALQSYQYRQRTPNEIGCQAIEFYISNV